MLVLCHDLPLSLWIVCVSETVTDEVECDDNEGNQESYWNPDICIVGHCRCTGYTVDHGSPGGKRVLYTETKEGECGFCKDGSTDSHGCDDDKLWHDVRNKMLEDPILDLDACSFSGNHELLLPEGKDLASDHSGHTSPAHESQGGHHDEKSCVYIHSHGIHDTSQDNHDRHGRKTVEYVYSSHDQVIDPTAVVSSKTTKDDADEL